MTSEIIFLYTWLCNYYLNKNTKGAKKGKANQKQQLSTKKFDITQRPRSLEHNDIANVDNVYR